MNSSFPESTNSPSRVLSKLIEKKVLIEAVCQAGNGVGQVIECSQDLMRLTCSGSFVFGRLCDWTDIQCLGAAKGHHPRANQNLGKWRDQLLSLV
jgi:hypothetical protein